MTNYDEIAKTMEKKLAKIIQKILLPLFTRELYHGYEVNKRYQQHGGKMKTKFYHTSIEMINIEKITLHNKNKEISRSITRNYSQTRQLSHTVSGTRHCFYA